MKCRGLVFATLFTVVITGFVLSKAGWLTASRSASHRPRGHVKAQDPFATEAGERWRHCQPHHWRACLLQR